MTNGSIRGFWTLAAPIVLTLSFAVAAFAVPTLNPMQGSIDKSINKVLQLNSSWHTTLNIDLRPERPIVVEIPFRSSTYTLELEPHSVRAEDHKVFMQDDEGQLYEVPAGPVRTLRGSVAEVSGSVVAASLMVDGLHARIRLGNGTEFWMEPVGEKISGSNRNLYAFYLTEDIIASGGLCGAEDHMDVGRILEMLSVDKGNESLRGDVICTAQLGVDTDYEYYQDWENNTESRIEQVVNAINSQYEDEVGLTHEITTIIVRSSSNDPYTSSNAETLLGQFGQEWETNQSSVPRDLAHLFTGKNLQNGTIGIAWLGAVCSNGYEYGLAQSDCCGSFGCTTDLSAHEMGHNWGASHQTSPSFNTMYPSLQCANLFIQNSINEITGYADSINCLSCSNQAPTGACCIGSQCVVIYETNCNAGGGVWQGDNTECTSSSCVAPQGACCVDGVCYEYEEADCQSAGGDYAGDETNCSTVGCSLGACCVGLDCSLTLLSDCSGSWFGDNTTCADVSCGEGADELNYELRTWSRSDGQLMETYDVYFPSTDPNTRMVSVFGQNSDLLQIRGWSNAAFDGSASLVAVHQSVYGADLAHDRNLDILGDDVVYDSYVTIGSDDAADGVPNLLGFDSAGFNSAAGIYMDNGVWFVTPDSPLASMGSGSTLGHRVNSLSVEVGQGVEILCNVQWYDGAGTVHETRNIYWNNYGLGGGGNDCPSDIDGSGDTNVTDLLAAIAAWGPCSGDCPADLDGSGEVNVSDLLAIIAGWGPCE